MAGIRFITDEQGQKTDVVISLKEHASLVKDLLDSILVEERKNEESMPFKEFEEQLRAEGKLLEGTTKKPLRFGMTKGTFIISDDFDDPLDFS